MSFMSARIFGSVPSTGLASWLTDVLARIECYRRARLERAQLLAFDDRELHDIGLSRVDALRQANKSLWSGCSPSAIDLDLRRQP